MHQALSRPYVWSCSRFIAAGSVPTRGAFTQAFGSSGSPVIRMTCQRCRSWFAAAKSIPSSAIGLPACTSFPKTVLGSACSPARSTVVGIAPLSSMSASTFWECIPESVAPCSSALPVLGQAFGDRNHVDGWSFAAIRDGDQVNAAFRNSLFACHFANSAQRLSRRFCAVIDVARPFGCPFGVACVARKYQPHHARMVDLPGPAQACSEMRRIAGSAKATSASTCQGSGSAPNCSRTNSTAPYGSRR